MSDRLLFGGIVAAVTAAALWVQAGTPAALVALPERPDLGWGDSRVRIESSVYPRYATGADQVRVRIDRPPRRIVSQFWSIDEFLYAIVPPERIVAVSESAYSQASSNLLDLLGLIRPVVSSNPETVLRTNPDLVLTGESARWEITGVLRQAGLPVYRMFTSFDSLRSITDHMRLVGYLTGEDARAEAAIAEFQQTIARAEGRRPPPGARPRVLGMSGSYSYGARTLFDDVLRVLGAENIAATHGLVGYSRATDEHIVRWNPDWIVAGAPRGAVEATRQSLLGRPAVAATSAARAGRIIVISDDVFLPMSPFTARLVARLGQELYGADDAR